MDSSHTDESVTVSDHDEDPVTNPSDGEDEYSSMGSRVLPEELAKSVVVLECESSSEGGSCHVYLVGTAHVSKESCIEVQAVISCLKPQVVFLELCPGRVGILAPRDLHVPTMKEMIDTWKKKKNNLFGILYGWFLAKMSEELEVIPGSEFRVAYEEAQEYGAKVILGDRPIDITLRRTWGNMSLWHRAKLVYYLLFHGLFLPSVGEISDLLKEMNDADILTFAIKEMSKAFPSLMESLLYERDMYMSSTLLKVAQDHSSVVAVVGRGHLSGIKKHWKQPVEVKRLLEMPSPRVGVSKKVFVSLGVAVAGVVIASGMYIMRKK